MLIEVPTTIPLRIFKISNIFAKVVQSEKYICKYKDFSWTLRWTFSANWNKTKFWLAVTYGMVSSKKCWRHSFACRSSASVSNLKSQILTQILSGDRKSIGSRHSFYKIHYAKVRWIQFSLVNIFSIKINLYQIALLDLAAELQKTSAQPPVVPQRHADKVSGR